MTDRSVIFWFQKFGKEIAPFKGVLTTMGIRIYPKLKIIRPDIYKSNSLCILNWSEA